MWKNEISNMLQGLISVFVNLAGNILLFAGSGAFKLLLGRNKKLCSFKKIVSVSRHSKSFSVP